MHEDEDNDGRFPDESPVEIRYPRSKQEERGDRSRWPWLTGSILERAGPGPPTWSTEAGFTAVVRCTRIYDLGGAHGKTGSPAVPAPAAIARCRVRLTRMST
jgi:hypothetical protein